MYWLSDANKFTCDFAFPLLPPDLHAALKINIDIESLQVELEFVLKSLYHLNYYKQKKISLGNLKYSDLLIV